MGETAPRPGDEPRKFAVTLDRLEDYRFNAQFDQPGIPPLVVDEGPPIGEGSGPSPARLLATAVGHCMASSALFCLQKARIGVKGMKVDVSGTISRGETGRLRVTSMQVRITPEVDPADVARMSRCLSVFEDYCTVSGSVRQGIDIEVDVTPVS